MDWFTNWVKDTTWIKEQIVAWGANIAVALLILVIGRWLSKRVANVCQRLMDRTTLDPILIKFFSDVIYWTLVAVVVLAALDEAGVSVTSFIAVFGAAGLALGLALKDSLSNFASGVMLIVFRPFAIGDFIEAGGQTGVVESLGFFCTTMKTIDNKRIIVPNSTIFGNTIVNMTANPQRRIDLVIGISYGDDIKKAKSLVQIILENDSRILKDPEPTIGVIELGESSVDLYVRPWVNTADYWNTRCDLLEYIKTTFDENGITIPFPQRDIHQYPAGS